MNLTFSLFSVSSVVSVGRIKPLFLAQLLHQNLDDALCRVAVPLLRAATLGDFAAQYLARLFQNPGLVVTDHDVRADLAGDGTLGVGAHSDAGDAEDGGLLLQAAAVGEHQPGVHVEMEKFQIAQRLGDPDAFHLLAAVEKMPEAELFGHLFRAGMDGEDDGQLLRNFRQCFEDAGQNPLIVDVAGAVHGQRRVALGGQAQLAAQIEGRRQRPVLEQGVDHHVADEENLIGGHPLGGQVLVGEMVGGEEIVAKDVGAEAVDLLGHGHVPRAQPGLDVRDLDPQLLGGDGTGHGRIDVADDDDQIGPLLQADLFELDHDPRRLLGVGAAADLQVDIRLGHAEIDEKGLAHFFVVMLPGMHQQMLDLVGILVHGLDDRGHFHEVRPGTDHVDDFHRILLAGISIGFRR